MPEPPQLAPFNAKEQQLCSRSLTDDWTSHLICEGDVSHPTEKRHCSRLYPQSHSFGNDPSFMTKGEGRNKDWVVDRELCLSAQLSQQCGKVNAKLLLLRSPSLVNKTPKCLNSFTWGKDSFPTPVENRGFRFRGTDPHPSCFTLGCQLIQWVLKVTDWWCTTSSAKSSDEMRRVHHITPPITSTPQDPVLENHKQDWWQGAALVEAKLIQIWISLTAAALD